MEIAEIAPFTCLPDIRVRQLPETHEFAFLSGRYGGVLEIGPLIFHSPISVAIYGHRGEAFAFKPSELEIVPDDYDGPPYCEVD